MQFELPAAAKHRPARDEGGGDRFVEDLHLLAHRESDALQFAGPVGEFGLQMVLPDDAGAFGVDLLADEDRFRHVKLEYLPADVETDLVLDRTGLDDDRRQEIEDLVALAGRLREAYVDGELSTPVTTRELVRIAQFIQDDFMDLKAAAKSELVARVSEYDESLVQTYIAKRL